MKVQNNYDRATNSVNRGNEKASEAKTALSSGNSKVSTSWISQKQNQAQKKAMGIVKRAFAGERKIDDNVTRHKMKIASIEGDIRRNNEEIKLIKQKQDDLQELAGVGYNDKEQKDLRLMLKNNLSEKETKYVNDLRNNGLSAYQQRWLEFENEKTIYREFNAKLIVEINTENDSINSIMEERKKHNPIKDAIEAAEDLLEAASKEVKEMVLQDIIGNIENEGREFREKLLEKQFKDQKERADSNKKANESAPQTNIQEKVKEDIKHMLAEINLIDEDIKGAVVDGLV